MNPKEELFEEYRAGSIDPQSSPGTEIYLALVEAMEFARRCEDLGLAIGRIEGFGYQDELIHQRLDLIWEFDFATDSWREYQRVCNDSALGVLLALARKNEPFVVTFVVETEDDWMNQRTPSDGS